MRLKILIIVLLALNVFSYAGHREIKMSGNLKPYIVIDDYDDARIFVRHGDVIVRTRDADEGRVVITRDNELFVNGEKVALNASLQIKVEQYHGLVVRCMKDVKHLAIEGAKMGISGAAIGVKAVAGVFHMILPKYGPDEFERDMDIESAKIEAKAEKLEAKADLLDEMLDDIEEIHDTLRESVPELDALGWF